jgi:hypothetical protein
MTDVDTHKQQLHPLELALNTNAALAYANPEIVSADVPMSQERQDQATAAIQANVDALAAVGVEVDDPRLSGNSPPGPDPDVEPAVTAINPTSGGKGTAITLTGTYLTGTTRATIDTRSCTSLTVVSDTQVTANTPAGSGGQLVKPGDYPIIVTVDGVNITGPTFTVV